MVSPWTGVQGCQIGNSVLQLSDFKVQSPRLKNIQKFINFWATLELQWENVKFSHFFSANCAKTQTLWNYYQNFHDDYWETLVGNWIFHEEMWLQTHFPVAFPFERIFSHLGNFCDPFTMTYAWTFCNPANQSPPMLCFCHLGSRISHIQDLLTRGTSNFQKTVILTWL